MSGEGKGNWGVAPPWWGAPLKHEHSWKGTATGRGRAAKPRFKFSDGNFGWDSFFWSSPEMRETPSLTLSKSSPTSVAGLALQGKNSPSIVTSLLLCSVTYPKCCSHLLPPLSFLSSREEARKTGVSRFLQSQNRGCQKVLDLIFYYLRTSLSSYLTCGVKQGFQEEDRKKEGQSASIEQM